VNRFPVRLSPPALAVGIVALLLAGCGSSGGGAPGAKKLAFELTDAGCEPHDAKAPAGRLTFEVENAGSSKVTELEVLEGETILGEIENLSEGLSGNFPLSLEPGEYTLRCNGGDEEDGTLTITGGAKTKSDPEAEAAVADYRTYLEQNTDELVAKTAPFVAAVVAGNAVKARALYPAARIPYERIEPVAESFGDLDPRIDARENDVPRSEFGGFHRIEKALWSGSTAGLHPVVIGTTKGMAPVAKRLLADVEELQQKVKNVDLQAVQIANGANELLGEVSASKNTGEEERYSHTDLVDFESNVEGAEAAFNAVEPLLNKKDPKLAKEIEASFKDVYASLEPYRRGGGFVLYTKLTKADTRKLAQEIEALAELMSQVPAQIV
jgi:iron uptake system component EfeO